MVFRTDREKSKWDQLQATSEVSIDKLLDGKASPADIKALSLLVSKQHEMAGKIFDEGISSAEATADAIIDKMNADRIASGKKPLTQKAQSRLFDATFQKVLSASAEDIIGSVQDYMDEKFGSQEAAQKEAINDAFDRIRNLASPAPNATRNPNVWRPGSGRPPPAAGQSPVAAIARLTSALTDEHTTDRQTGRRSILGGLRDFIDSQRALRNLRNSTTTTEEDVRRHFGVESPDEVADRIQSLNQRNPTLQQSTPVDLQLRRAQEDADRLREKAEREWRRIESNQGNEDEDKKSNTWLRKIKGMFDFKKNKRDSEKGNSSFLGTLGKVLLLALLNPELIRTIADGISKYLNFDTISGFISDTWKSIKEAGGSILSWIWEQIKDKGKKAVDATKDFLGLGDSAKPAPAKGKTVDSLVVSKSIPANTTAADAARTIPEIEKSIARTKEALAASQKADAENSTPSTKAAVTSQSQRLADLQSKLTQYQAKQSGSTKPANVQSMAGPTPAPASSAPQTAASGSTSLTGPPPSAVLSASNAATTSVASGTPVAYKEGITVDSPTQGANKVDTAATGSAVSGKVSLASFGFQSGDDTMNLLNMGIVA